MQADSAQQQGLYRPEFDHDACGIGALADINGERHHQILDDALSILVNLEHRGGTGLEKNTGDGAGILFQVPHHFFRKEAQKCGQILPAEGDYGVAMLFFPQDDKGVEDARRVFEEGCAEAGVPLLFWREVPVDPHDLGETARACMPTILQAFLGRPDDTPPLPDWISDWAAGSALPSTKAPAPRNAPHTLPTPPSTAMNRYSMPLPMEKGVGFTVRWKKANSQPDSAASTAAMTNTTSL